MTGKMATFWWLITNRKNIQYKDTNPHKNTKCVTGCEPEIAAARGSSKFLYVFVQSQNNAERDRVRESETESERERIASVCEANDSLVESSVPS